VGHNDGNDEAMPVEESGNMVIMALSYALKTGDNSHLQQYVRPPFCSRALGLTQACVQSAGSWTSGRSSSSPTA
jgi:hypothetical protein